MKWRSVSWRGMLQQRSPWRLLVSLKLVYFTGATLLLLPLTLKQLKAQTAMLLPSVSKASTVFSPVTLLHLALAALSPQTNATSIAMCRYIMIVTIFIITTWKEPCAVCSFLPARQLHLLICRAGFTLIDALVLLRNCITAFLLP